MKYFVITAVGEDRPGIVEKVTELLYRLGFNLEDSSMTRLNNEFTIMLIVSTDKDISVEQLKKEFETLEKQLSLLINVKEIPEEIFNQKKEIEDIYNIVVYGSDKPGIVYKVAKLLSKNGINIADLKTEKSNDLYVMIIEAEFPKNVDIQQFNEDLENLKSDLNVDISCEKIESIEI